MLRKSNPPEPEIDFVFLSVVRLREDAWMAREITRNRAKWADHLLAPEVLYTVALQRLGPRLFSSRKSVPQSAERRNVEAGKMWDRWVARGIALYHKACDRYEFLGESDRPRS